MSTVVVTEEQQESSRGETIAIANYNHAHALTVMYFEVLQHYRVQIELDDHQPLFYEFPLPAHEFTAELIDPWAMTVTVLPGTFKGKSKIRLTARPFQAVRFRRVR